MYKYEVTLAIITEDPNEIAALGDIAYSKFLDFPYTAVSSNNSLISTPYWNIFFNSKLFSYDTDIVLYISLNFDRDSIYVYIWDYSSSQVSPPIYYIDFIQDTDYLIFNAQYDYSFYTDILTSVVYRKEINTAQFYFTLYQIPVYDILNYSLVDLNITPSSGNEADAHVMFLKVVGPWIFICTHYPHECFSWLSNDIDPTNISDGEFIAKFPQTFHGDNSPIKWWISDLVFYESESYGEITPYLMYFETISNTLPSEYPNVYLSKMDGYTGDGIYDKVCFNLVNEHPDNGSKYCTLRCADNQYHDSTSSFECKFCPNGEYVKDNKCVTTCGAALGVHVTVMGYCSNSMTFDTWSNAISSNFNIYSCTNCIGNEIKVNDVCTSCNSNDLFQQNYICEEKCRYGYERCDGEICKEGPCGCDAKELKEGSNCVASCLLAGHVPDENGLNCIICPNNGYELDNETCLDLADDCPLNTYPTTDPDTLGNYCAYCPGQLVEVNGCVDSCLIDGNISYSGLYCAPCQLGEYELYKTSCVPTENDCPIGYVPAVNAANNNANFCKNCGTQVIEENECKLKCTIPGNVPNSNSYCEPCPSGSEFDNLTCENPCPSDTYQTTNPSNSDASYCE